MEFSGDEDCTSEVGETGRFKSSCVFERAEEEALPVLSGSLFCAGNPGSETDPDRLPPAKKTTSFSPVSEPSPRPLSLEQPLPFPNWPISATGPTTPSMMSWRIQSTGLLWNIMKTLARQGHTAVSVSEMHRLYELVPNLDLNPEMVHIFVMTLQTLAVSDNAENTLRTWARQEGTVPAMDNHTRPLQMPYLQPWAEPRLWSFEDHCLALEVINQFLSVGYPSNEKKLTEKLGGAYHMARERGWVVEVIAFVLEFVRTSGWFWPILFRQ